MSKRTSVSLPPPSGMLFVDVLSVLPFWLLDLNSGMPGSASLLRMPRLLRLFKLMKLLKGE